MCVYDVNIIDVGEVDEGVILIDSIGTGDVIGVCGVVAFLIIIYFAKDLPRSIITKAKTNSVRPNSAPMIVQNMSVFLRSWS